MPVVCKYQLLKCVNRREKAVQSFIKVPPSIFCRFAKKIGVDIKDLPKPHFPETVERVTVSIDIQVMSTDLGTDACTLELIISAFKRKTHEDNIISYCRPVYSMTVQATEQIREGMSLTGKLHLQN